jgi:anti-anti-sigma regulatory factor
VGPAGGSPRDHVVAGVARAPADASRSAPRPTLRATARSGKDGLISVRRAVRDDPAGDSGFRVELRDVPGEEVLVVEGRGELDLATKDELREAIADVRGLRRVSGVPVAAEHRLVIDLTRATYLGATIIAALVEEARSTPGPARLVVGGHGLVSRVAAVLELGDVFEIVDNLPAALSGAEPES